MKKIATFLLLLTAATFSYFGCQQNKNGKTTMTETRGKSAFDYVAKVEAPPPPPPPPSFAERKAIEAQEDSVDLQGVSTVVDSMPTYKEGFPAYLKFVHEHLESPNFPRMIYGTIYIRAVVEIDGTLTHLRVKRGIGGGWNEFAIRVLEKTSGHWQCGTYEGHAVRAAIVVPVKCDGN